MSDDHDDDNDGDGGGGALTGEADDQLRRRLRALALEVGERTDAEAAFDRVSRRAGPSATRFLAIAACVLAVLAVAVALVPDSETVGTTDQPPATDCPDTGGALAPTPTPGGEMNTRFAAPVATAATAILLIGACGDDGPTLLARGTDVEIVGEGDGFAGQTLNIDAQEEDGEATGEFRVTDVVNTVRCADTGTEGFVILGGEVTAGAGGIVALGQLNALIIREGDPDAVQLYGNDAGAETCTELLESIPAELLDDEEAFLPLEGDSDIETG